MANSSLHALEFLTTPPAELPSVVVVHGPDAYLCREVLRTIRQLLTPDEEEDFSRTFAGASATLAEVVDELSTVSLFGGSTRLAIVEDADTFITQFRSGLERYVQSPSGHGVLVLAPRKWQSNARIAKAVAAEGLTIRCDPPQPAALRKWLERRAREMDVTVEREAWQIFFDALPNEIGIYEHELAKLAAYVGAGGTITPAVVRENVGGGRIRQTWDMIDAAAAGNPREALVQLDRLLSAGDDPLGILPQMAGVLRRYVLAGRLVEAAEQTGKRPNLRGALKQAGIPSFKLSEAESTLRQLGRDRVDRLLTWLLETDLALKGPHSRTDLARRQLETLIVRLAKSADPRRAVR